MLNQDLEFNRPGKIGMRKRTPKKKDTDDAVGLPFFELPQYNTRVSDAATSATPRDSFSHCSKL